MQFKNIRHKPHQNGNDDGQPDVYGSIGRNFFVSLPAGTQLVFGDVNSGNIFGIRIIPFVTVFFLLLGLELFQAFLPFVIIPGLVVVDVVFPGFKSVSE